MKLAGTRAALLALLGLIAAGTTPAATITIVAKDGAYEGFNNLTPFTPIGGNNATTLGQARLNVFNEAARLWGRLIESAVPIVVEANFDPMTCSANSGVLGSAGPLWIFHDFPNAPIANVFYPAALADALTGTDLASKTDIGAHFNSSVNGNAGCLGGSYFYFGLDHQLTGHNDGRNYVADLLAVVLHEIGHGLGFVSIVDQNGMGVAGTDHISRLGVFEQFTFEESLNMYWSQMNAAQRMQSSTGWSAAGPGTLVWNAPHVNTSLARLTAGVSPGGHLRLYAPATFDASSSVSHWDSSANPDLLMESRYTSTTGNHTDLTTCALYDMGWKGNYCPDGVSAAAQTVHVVINTATSITLVASDSDGDALNYSIVGGPTHGTLSALNGAEVTYTPNANFTGADQFSFQASDALVESNIAVVSLEIASATGSGGGAGNTVATSQGGGGGAVDWLALLALGLCIGGQRGAQAARCKGNGTR